MKLDFSSLICNPETGKVSRKSVVLWLMVAALLYIIGRGMESNVWPPEGIVMIVGGLIFGTLGLQVWDKKSLNANNESK